MRLQICFLDGSVASENPFPPHQHLIISVTFQNWQSSCRRSPVHCLTCNMSFICGASVLDLRQANSGAVLIHFSNFPKKNFPIGHSHPQQELASCAEERKEPEFELLQALSFYPWHNYLCHFLAAKCNSMTAFQLRLKMCTVVPIFKWCLMSLLLNGGQPFTALDTWSKNTSYELVLISP